MDECTHKQLSHWMGGYSSNLGNGVTHTGKCRKCSASFGPFDTWEEVRIAAGRKPAVKRLISERAILEAAADRLCRKTCDERGYRDSGYHCRTCPDRRAILEPITKEKS